MLCYSYILGKCNGKCCGWAVEGHVPVHHLNQELVDQLCKVLHRESTSTKAQNQRSKQGTSTQQINTDEHCETYQDGGTATVAMATAPRA